MALRSVVWIAAYAKDSFARLLLLALVLFGMGACSPRGKSQAGADSTDNLLARARIVQAEGVRHPERLNDGLVAIESDHWQTDLTAIFISSKSQVVFDLGEPKPIAAALLQGDNNDVYSIQVSDDGQNFRPLWSASQVSEPGLRVRSVAGLNARARYVKVKAGPGDTSFSLSEVQLFAEQPSPFPPKLTTLRGVKADDSLNSHIVQFAVALMAFVLLTGRGLPRWWNLLGLVLPCLGAWALWRGLDDAWPPGQREISLLRAFVALVAAVVVIRETMLPLLLGRLKKRFFSGTSAAPDFSGHRGYSLLTLGICGLLALATFGNLGHPQFWDYKLEEPSRVHNFDMRVYFPVAKYFKELQYDGLYQASVMAYVDDTPGLSLDAVGHVTIRDLKTHHMTRVRDVEREIRAVKARFSPERWQEFLGDMRYFRETMGLRDYLGSMHDHGGNATPVWMALAHVLFAHTQANNEVLWSGALLDPLLLLFAFAAVGRVFGVRTMLLSMVLFGANDYYMFGSNWFGATLRHDWMALLALGACALKRERWFLGGALLAWSALIRAFPAIALLAIMVPAVWWMVEQRKSTGHFPGWAAWRANQAPVLKVLLGATACVTVWFAVSTAMLGFDAWVQWANKMKLLTSGPHVNHVSLRALVTWDPRYTFEGLQAAPPPDTADWSVWQDRMFRARRFLYGALVVGYALAVAALARRRRLEQAAILGLMLIPVVSYPANYYAHFVFLLPLLVTERPWKEKLPVGLADALVWVAATLMCTALYWSVLAKELDAHFNEASLVLMLTLTAILAALLLEDRYRFTQRAEVWAGLRALPAARGGHKKSKRKRVAPAAIADACEGLPAGADPSSVPLEPQASVPGSQGGEPSTAKGRSAALEQDRAGEVQVPLAAVTPDDLGPEKRD
jgi:hypothetical protein